jgi:O-antigen ligase
VTRVTGFFFLATLFCCTWEKIHWTIAGNVELSSILALLFLASFIVTYRPRIAATSGVLLGFLGAFLVVYLMGFFNLDSPGSLSLFAKGMILFVIQFSFLITGVTWLWRQGQAYYWRALGWFCAGMVVNGIYGVLQLLAARSGHNLDAWLVQPITGGASRINLYGIVEGASVFRSNALTDDPNHLGIMLIVPLLVLTPLYLRLERDHPFRRRLGVTVAFLLLSEVTTLSRSGVLGLLTGAAILGVPYRHYLKTRVFIAPLLAVLAVLAVAVAIRPHYFLVIFQTRLDLGSTHESGHFRVYSFIPKILHSHPLLGLGWNTFSIYYQFVTGLTNWGPHSFWVALIVETGLLGTLLFASFLFWVFVRLRRTTHLGRALQQAGDPLGSRVVPLAWGWTAALAGTMTANVFYLTMQFYYFYVFLALALAVPLVFGSGVQRVHARAVLPAAAAA